MKEINLEAIKNEVLGIMEEKLPQYLTYHNTQHTLYVLSACKEICVHEKTSDSDFDLLQFACLLHDIGFINTYQNHEEEGCKIAREILLKYNLNETQIKQTCGMIMATKIPQTPKNKLEEIIADADLEYLGTDKYSEISERLYKEFKYFNINLNDIMWLQIQIDFLEKHTYFTQYCIQFKEPVKQINLNKLREKLNRISR